MMEDDDFVLVDFETSPRKPPPAAAADAFAAVVPPAALKKRRKEWWETTAARLEQLIRQPSMWSEADSLQAKQFADWAESVGKQSFWGDYRASAVQVDTKVSLTLCTFQGLLQMHSDMLRNAPDHQVKVQFLRMLEFPTFFMEEFQKIELEEEIEESDTGDAFHYVRFPAVEEGITVKMSSFNETLSNIKFDHYEAPTPVPAPRPIIVDAAPPSIIDSAPVDCGVIIETPVEMKKPPALTASFIANGLDEKKAENATDSDDDEDLKKRKMSSEHNAAAPDPSSNNKSVEEKGDPNELLVQEVLELFGLISRDVLGNDPQSKVHNILKAPLEDFLKQWIPDMFSKIAENKSYRDKVIADVRVNALRGFQSFTNDYHRSLELFRKKNSIEDFSKHRLSLSSEQSASSLIATLCQIIDNRGDPVIIDPKVFQEMDQSDIEAFITAKLDAAQQHIISCIVDRVCAKGAAAATGEAKSSSNKAQDLVAALMENLLTGCLSQLVLTLSDPSLWMMIFHRIPRLNFPEFPGTAAPPANRPLKDSSASEEKDIALDLGIEIMMVIRNLLDLAQPKGVAGFLAQVGRHVLRSYVEELGNGLWNELKTPIDAHKASFICKMIKCVLWDKQQNGDDFVFISRLSMYAQLKKEGSRREVQDSVVTELAEHVHNHALEKVPKGWSWVGNSLSSVYATVWTLAHLFVEVTQSPWILRFIILQYCLGPFAL
eukprot:TRINITY_DN13302_c0_g1_i1.p1 TRINITY_DN13302_c0_g1~~TRINITY_DN13302_c0_g1_i1.p1  ORF type:complete len:716 (+),score=216.00 TRINITY_DN13302_c0_g1_i1:1374-3521(+)